MFPSKDIIGVSCTNTAGDGYVLFLVLYTDGKDWHSAIQPTLVVLPNLFYNVISCVNDIVAWTNLLCRDR